MGVKISMFGECHAHIALDGRNYKAVIKRHALGVDKALVHEHFKAYQEQEIAFIRDGGDAWGVSAWAKTIAPQYGIDYRTPIFAIHKNGHYGDIVGRGFDTLKEYAALVEHAVKAGADFIKIMTSGIMNFNQFGAMIAGESLEPALVHEMVHIAHEEGLAVMSHTNGAEAILAAIEAGVDSIEHGNYIGAEGIKALADTGTVFVPTATVAYNFIGAGLFDDSVLERIADTSRNAISQAYSADVLLALGSDAGAAGVLHGCGVESEYDFFLSCGFDKVELDNRLARGESAIKNKFQRS